MAIKSMLLAAATLASVAVPGVAAAQGYPAYGYRGESRDDYRFHDRREERRFEKERRREERERYRAWRYAHRHDRYGYDGYRH